MGKSPEAVIMPLLLLLAFMRLQENGKTPEPDTRNDKVAMAASIKELQEAAAVTAAGTTVILRNGDYHKPCAAKGKGKGSKGLPLWFVR